MMELCAIGTWVRRRYVCCGQPIAFQDLFGMVARLLRRLIQKNRAFLLSQVLDVKGLMQLLMKNRNTGEKWSPEELRQIRAHLRGISRMVPVILVFLLPGGAFLLPLLAEVLDRRKQTRPTPEGPVGPGT
jgi:hypothetical protein